MKIQEQKILSHLLQVAREENIDVYWCKSSEVVNLVFKIMHRYEKDLPLYSAMVETLDDVTASTDNNDFGSSGCADNYSRIAYGMMKTEESFLSMLICIAHEIGHIIQKYDSQQYAKGVGSVYETEESAWDCAAELLSEFMKDPVFMKEFYRNKAARIDTYSANHAYLLSDQEKAYINYVVNAEQVFDDLNELNRMLNELNTVMTAHNNE
jgi:hypothetical protein